MPAATRVLVAEDEPSTAYVLEQALTRAGFECTVVGDGSVALERMRHDAHDVLLTDWLMPGMNGIDLIREVRRAVKPAPLIVMVTSIDTDAGRSVAMLAGADEFLAKPAPLARLVQVLGRGLQRMQTPAPAPADLVSRAVHAAPPPPHPALLVAASTGGPLALTHVVGQLGVPSHTPVFIVQHGPDWMLRQLATRLGRAADCPAHYVDRACVAEPGALFLAPSGHDLKLELRATGEVWICPVTAAGFSAPMADPLFTSAAEVYGRFCAAAVLTGLGADGTRGATDIRLAGGQVLAQDPSDAVAPGMPSAAIAANAVNEVVPLERIGARLRFHAQSLARTLSYG